MMERYKGYWISGTAVPGPPYTRYWETLGTVLKDGHSGSVVEVERFRDNSITFDHDVPGFAEFYGMGTRPEYSLIVVCPQSEMVRYLFCNCPRCASYLGTVLREPGRTPHSRLLTGITSNATTGLPG